MSVMMYNHMEFVVQFHTSHIHVHVVLHTFVHVHTNIIGIPSEKRK